MISYFILKIHFYKHHYFSIIVNIIIFFIIFIIDIINKIKFDSFDGYIFLFYPFQLLFYSLEYAYAKKVFLYGFSSPYYLLIIKGVIKFCFVFIFSLIVLSVDKSILERLDFFFDDTGKNIKIIIDIIFLFLKNMFLYIIIERFSPNYLPLGLIFEECFYLIEESVRSQETSENTMGWDIYLRIFLYVISAIGVMIHNEIIIINICNLGSDTKYFLDLEVEREELFISTDDPDIIKKFETEMEDENEAN